MKFSVVFAFTLFTTFLFAQEVPRGVSQIVIENSRTASENLSLVLTALLRDKYTIEQKDKDSGIITTGKLSVDKTGLKIKFNIFCQDNKIVITGLVYLLGDGQEENEELIVNRGDTNSPYLKSFDKMNQIALKFPGKRVYK